MKDHSPSCHAAATASGAISCWISAPSSSYTRAWAQPGLETALHANLEMPHLFTLDNCARRKKNRGKLSLRMLKLAGPLGANSYEPNGQEKKLTTHPNLPPKNTRNKSKYSFYLFSRMVSDICLALLKAFRKRKLQAKTWQLRLRTTLVSQGPRYSFPKKNPQKMTTLAKQGFWY